MRIFYRIVFYALSVVIMGVISTSPDLNKTEGYNCHLLSWIAFHNL
jgi:hypothetical protein